MLIRKVKNEKNDVEYHYGKLIIAKNQKIKIDKKCKTELKKKRQTNCLIIIERICDD